MTPLVWQRPGYFIWQALTGTWGGKTLFQTHSRAARRFYRLKAALCILINREPSRRASYDLWSAGIPIVYTDGGSYSTVDQIGVHWFECILVGEGILRNWWCTLYQESN